MNSLIDKDLRCKEVEPKKDGAAAKEKEEVDHSDDSNKDNVDEESDSDTDPEELKNKFLLLMAEGIKKRKEEEKERLIEEDNKKNEDEEDKKESDKKGKGKEEDEDTKEQQQQQQQCRPVDESKSSKYASYGTTFDRHNVCWEFNTFVGCRKGTKCKWAHQYLVKESAHPYTGEKLNGMAVRKFRQSNNI